MASLARETSRRHDTRRRRRQPTGPIESDAESGPDDLDPQPRASHHQRKLQKQQKPTHVTFNGPVTISGDILVGYEGRDHRRRDPSPPLTRRSTGRLRAASKRPAVECDSQSESSTDSEASSSSSSVDNVPRSGPSMQHAKSRAPAERLRLPSDRRMKRYNPDEGYHTSGTAASTGVEQNRKSTKGKTRAAVSTPRRDLAAPAHAKPPREKTFSRVSDTAVSQSDASDVESISDINGIAEEDHADEDASDEDFGKLLVQIGCTDSSMINEEAVLDTGTKHDWISQTFFETLRKKAGVKSVKLASEETRKYRDFNGKSFSPTHKVELMIQSDEFLGMKCRNLSFLIARDATFSILIGRRTIYKEELMFRRKRETDGEGAHVGILGDVSKAEKARIKKNKEDQDKIKQERKKQREAKMEEEESNKQKSRTKQSSSQSAACLATMDPRRTRSPQQGAKGATKNSQRKSDSSLEGTW
ncbi:hypothetical protein BKA64DRAFT_377985 [Cadophora sp. MPI-SDFR-AT-0126]|nr:hypothetical protein BKA64DRAFT_377985 [Leotiomycetes sp. MPI-SDFR-AT-0126]